ncbi:hypothetical protein [Algoriphagus sediminis]|uniref:Lipoprotein n=1 Tax=Algoriphagus sediminis TaxID=3057113 RepID=A0ABT7YFD1_9BACT|nr:hypothetical protein [Algoriphagus sediminis]MDN3205238.1 hypothetical protein [Algoriphagus sediminis]
MKTLKSSNGILPTLFCFIFLGCTHQEDLAIEGPDLKELEGITEAMFNFPERNYSGDPFSPMPVIAEFYYPVVVSVQEEMISLNFDQSELSFPEFKFQIDSVTEMEDYDGFNLYSTLFSPFDFQLDPEIPRDIPEFLIFGDNPNSDFENLSCLMYLNLRHFLPDSTGRVIILGGKEK